MSNDSDWVSEVRRWVRTNQQQQAQAPAVDDPDSELGYEAAHPLLQARHWPDAPTSGLADLR